MPYVREADVENPAIAKLGGALLQQGNLRAVGSERVLDLLVLPAVGRPKHQKLLDDDDQPSRRCSFGFLKAGWFWAVVIVVTVICVSVWNV
jgi:hypothetical protein